MVVAEPRKTAPPHESLSTWQMIFSPLLFKHGARGFFSRMPYIEVNAPFDTVNYHTLHRSQVPRDCPTLLGFYILAAGIYMSFQLAAFSSRLSPVDWTNSTLGLTTFGTRCVQLLCTGTGSSSTETSEASPRKCANDVPLLNGSRVSGKRSTSWS